MGDNDALDWLKRRAEKKQSPSFGFNSSAQTSTSRLGHTVFFSLPFLVKINEFVLPIWPHNSPIFDEPQTQSA